MDFISLLIIAFFGFFLVVEGKESFRMLSQMRKAMEQIKENKQDVQVCKDYMGLVITYVILAGFILCYGIYFMAAKQNYMYGLMFIVLALFCIVFITDSITTRTFVFYDNGFLFAGKTFRYRSVVKIDEKKKFLRGYRVKLTSDDEVYVTKNIKPVMEERLKEFKNRKKDKHEK